MAVKKTLIPPITAILGLCKLQPLVAYHLLLPLPQQGGKPKVQLKMEKHKEEVRWGGLLGSVCILGMEWSTQSLCVAVYLMPGSLPE